MSGYSFPSAKVGALKQRIREVTGRSANSLRKAMSDGEAQVYLKLCKAAEAGVPCPSNHELAIGIHRNGGLKQLQMLARKGYIIVHREGWVRRRIEIVETGKMTDWAGRYYPERVAQFETDDSILEARKATEIQRRERENYWLELEAKKYGTPKARPISEMVA